jgi:hypothetical protein
MRDSRAYPFTYFITLRLPFHDLSEACSNNDANNPNLRAYTCTRYDHHATNLSRTYYGTYRMLLL